MTPHRAPPGNNLKQVVHTLSSVTKQYNLVPASPMGRKQAHRAIHWPHIRGLAVVKTGVWLRALENGDQRRPTGGKAQEGLYVTFKMLKHTKHTVKPQK